MARSSAVWRRTLVSCAKPSRGRERSNAARRTVAGCGHLKGMRMRARCPCRGRIARSVSAAISASSREHLITPPQHPPGPEAPAHHITPDSSQISPHGILPPLTFESTSNEVSLPLALALTSKPTRAPAPTPARTHLGNMNMDDDGVDMTPAVVALSCSTQKTPWQEHENNPCLVYLHLFPS